MSSVGGVRVACILSDSFAFRRVREAIESEGSHVVALTQPAILSATRRGGIDALVYDMEPGDTLARDFVMRLHWARPDWPVWLYYPPRFPVIERVAELATLRGIYATRQGAGQQYVAEVHVHLRHLIDAVPRVRLLHLLDSILRPVPPDVRTFLALGLERRGGSVRQRSPVRTGSSVLHTNPRRLERICHQATLPGPKRLLAHLTLVLVTFRTFAFDVSLRRAAEQSGFSLKAFHALYNRALGADAQSARLEPRAQFELALMALAKACNVPGHAADEVVERVARERLA